MRFINLSTKIFAIVAITAVCFGSCKKSTSTTKPKLTLKKVNTFDVPRNTLLAITLECTNIDQIFTTTDTAIGAKFTVTNGAACSGSPGLKSRIIRYNIPQVPAFSGKSEIVINWVNGSNGVGLPAGYGPLPVTNCRPVDTTIIKLWVKSKTGGVSDTITLGPVAIHNN